MSNTNFVLYQFSKKENSTKRPPAGTTSLDVSGIMIDNTSVMYPKIRFRFSSITYPINYNYAYSSDFSRYYFITDWAVDNGFWIATMKVDVLATGRTDIRGASEYVLRSGSRKNGDIEDTYYPVRGTGNIELRGCTNEPFHLPDPDDVSSYCIVVGTVGGNVGGTSVTNKIGVSYYAMTPYTFNRLMSWMNQNVTDYLNVTDVTSEMLKSLYDPFQYIVCAKQLPCSVAHNVTAEAIQFGYWSTPSPVYGNIITARFQKFESAYIELADHPQISRGSYLNLAPYREIIVHAPPFGDIPIDTTKIIGAQRLAMRVQIDNFTGDAVLEIKGSSQPGGTAWGSIPGGVAATAYANIAYDIPLSQVRTDYMGEAEAVLSAGQVAQNIVANPINAMSEVASYIGNVAQSAMPQVSIKPNQGGALHSYEYWTSYQKMLRVVDQDNTDMGSPLCEYVALSTLSGYCQVSHANLAINYMTADENIQIKEYMEKGFFLE